MKTMVSGEAIEQIVFCVTIASIHRGSSGQCTEQTSGVCSFTEEYRRSYAVSYQSNLEKQKYYKACGFLGWSRCAAYRQLYRTVYRTSYRTDYREAYRCCNGWRTAGNQCTPVCSSSCLNGGTCCGPNHCQCVTGYSGNRCQTPICNPPCLHGGTCTRPDTCACPEGFTGNRCETFSNTCPPDIAISNDPGQSGAIVEWNITKPAEDTEVTSIHSSGDFFSIGSTIVTYMFDSASIQSSCSFTITVLDTEPPTIKCPDDAEYFAESGSLTIQVHWDPPMASDNSEHVPRLVSFTRRKDGTLKDINRDSEFSIGVTGVVSTAFDDSDNSASCNFTVTVTARCPKDMTNSIQGELIWEATIAENTAESLQRCPVKSAKRNHGLASRKCSRDEHVGALWEKVEINDCGEIQEYQEQDLAKSRVTEYNVEEVLEALVNVTDDAKVTDRQLDIESVLQTLANIVTLESSSKQVTERVFKVVDNVMGTRNEILPNDRSKATITSGIAKLLDQQVEQTMEKEEQLIFTGEKLSLAAVTVMEQDKPTGLGFFMMMNNSADDICGINFGIDTLLTTTDDEDILRNESMISIWLPKHLFQYQNDTKVSFVMYSDNSLFHSSSLQETEHSKPHVACPIVSATVIGTEISNMSYPFVFHTFPGKAYKTFLNANKDASNKSTCVFWDFNENNGTGDWSNEGCELVNADDGWITCHCHHLSTFAVILEVPIEIDNSIDLALKIISKTGSALSILALAFVIAVLLSRKVDMTRARKILLHFCLSAFCLYLLVLVGIEISRWLTEKIVCPIIGALIHYFILTSASWMAFEARSIYSALITDFQDDGKDICFLVIASLIAWGLPLLIVGIPFALRREDFGHSDHCYPGPGYIQHFALLLPVGIILLHNLVTLVLVGIRMVKISTQKNDSERLKQRLQDALLISSILEISWVSWVLLELPLPAEATPALSLVFAIASAFPGILIAVLFYFRQDDVRHLIITCCFKKFCSENPEPPIRHFTASRHDTSGQSNLPDIPGYLVPFDQNDTYAAVGAQSIDEGSESSRCAVEYSYAACENIYEDYENMAPEGDCQSSTDSDTLASSKRVKSIYEVDSEEERAGNNPEAKCDPMDAAPPLPDRGKTTFMFKRVNDEDADDGTDDDDYEPVQNPDNTMSNAQGKSVADYWTEVQEIEGQDQNCAECDSLKDSNNRKDSDVDPDNDDDYEPVQSSDTVKINKKVQLRGVVDYWTKMDEVEKSDNEYAECDSVNSVNDEDGVDYEDPPEDDYDYEKIQTPDDRMRVN